MLQLILTGRIGKDAETRTTQGGKKVTSFPVAVTVGWGDKKRTEWLDCSMWGDRGDVVGPYLLKGQQVTIRGQAGCRAYIKRGESEPVATMTCMVDEVDLQGSNGNMAQRGGQNPTPSQVGKSAPNITLDDLDDEIPF